MKAVGLHEYKRPPSVDEVPQPDLESHDDVLVRVGAAGVATSRLVHFPPGATYIRLRFRMRKRVSR